MNKVLGWTLVGVGVLAAGVAIAYGSWYAWDRGHVGRNPRALTPEAAGEAARRQATVSLAQSGGARTCVPLSLAAPEAQGPDGIAPRSVPGQHAITYLVRTTDRQQPVRDEVIAQLNYLAGQQFLAVTQAGLETNGGTLPALRYQLTWEGYKALRPDGGSGLCLPFGRREIVAVGDVQPTGDAVAGLPVYGIQVTSKVLDAPGWTRTAEALRLFPALAQETQDRTDTVNIVRTPEGWRSLWELQSEMQMAAAGGSVRPYLRELVAQAKPARPASIEEGKAALARLEADASWGNRAVACLPLNLQRGGDDRNVSREAGVPFTYTFHDRPDRKSYELRSQLNALHVLSALEAVGLAQRETLVPPAPPAMPPGLRGAAARAAPPPVTAPPAAADRAVGGVRFTIRPEVISALGLESGGGCFPVGRTSLEVLAVQPQPTGYGGMEGARARLLVRAQVQQAPDWVQGLAAQLPALKSLQDHGLAYEGDMGLQRVDGVTSSEWRVHSLQPRYPEMNYSTLPVQLLPLLPRTAEILPAGRQLQAPGLVQADPQAQAEAIRETVAAANRAAASAAAAAATRERLAAAAPLPAAAAVVTRTPPYPARGAPVHVVAMYEGAYASGSRAAGDHPPGTADVTVSVPDAVLLLVSYEPVEWRIKASSPVRQIVASGYYAQKVTYNGPGRPEIATPAGHELATRAGLKELPSIGHWVGDRNQLVQVADLAQGVTGQQPASFQAPRGDDRRFVVSAATPAFQLPPTQSPQNTRGAIALRSGSQGEVEGTTLRRGSSGAYTDAWTDRSFSAGRGYFEATMRVTGALAGHTHANVGLCPAQKDYIDTGFDHPRVMRHGEQRLYQDGDVFGLAVDFDRQRLYVRVNGRWLQGEPGGAGGIALEKGKEYRACVFAAGTVTGEVARGTPRSDTTWELNFGGRPFRAAPPAGYSPLQGS